MPRPLEQRDGQPPKVSGRGSYPIRTTVATAIMWLVAAIMWWNFGGESAGATVLAIALGALIASANRFLGTRYGRRWESAAVRGLVVYAVVAVVMKSVFVAIIGAALATTTLLWVLLSSSSSGAQEDPGNHEL